MDVKKTGRLAPTAVNKAKGKPNPKAPTTRYDLILDEIRNVLFFFLRLNNNNIIPPVKVCQKVFPNVVAPFWIEIKFTGKIRA